MLGTELTKTIIDCAIEVHRWLGPGLLEAVYEEALCYELHARKVAFKRQQRLPVRYKGVLLSSELRLDLLVDDQVIVDVKAKESLARTDKPQLLTYLRLCDLRVGLILNFHVAVMKEEVFRVMNGFPNESLPTIDPPDFRTSGIIQ